MEKCCERNMKLIRPITAGNIIIYCCIFLSMGFFFTGCSYDEDHKMKKGTLTRAIFPPSDLYDMVLKKEIDIAEKGYKDSFSFKLKYSGLYSIGVIFDRFPVIFDRKSHGDLSLRLKIDFFYKDKLTFSQKTGEPILYFASKDGHGLWLARFYSSDTIPLGESINCKIEVLTSDVFFVEQYGIAELFIKKVSEK
jgi:hypothetical protein